MHGLQKPDLRDSGSEPPLSSDHPAWVRWGTIVLFVVCGISFVWYHFVDDQDLPKAIAGVVGIVSGISALISWDIVRFGGPGGGAGFFGGGGGGCGGGCGGCGGGGCGGCGGGGL